ncbi:MAG: hypothetical protein DRH57_07400, partial [Candidatus Cloacimonadota bacterium]
QIAQGNWDRAKEILDDFSNDWKDAQDWKIKAAQMQINLLGENLAEVQEKSKLEAQNKLDWFREDYNRILDTQEEVKKLMLAYNSRGAGININDNFETALQKIMPYTKSDQDILDRLNELKLESAEVELLLQKKSLAKSGTGDGYAPSALKKLYNELGGQKGTGMTYNEFYESEKGDGGDTTFQSAIEDTASYLIGLRDSGKSSDINYAQAINGVMSDFGIQDKEQVESAINNIMSGGTPTVETEENVGSDFDYTPLVFKSEEGIAKSKKDLPRDAKIIYDKLKKENPYSSAAFLIREALRRAGLS